MKKIIFLALVFQIFVTGCAADEGIGNKDNTALFEKKDPKPMDVIYGMDHDDYGAKNPNEGLITEVKKVVLENEALYDVIVVKKDKEILVAYKVKHLKRFKMKQIEKDVSDKLEQTFPEFDFKVSSDYKIFLELLRLNEMLKAKDVPEKKAKKQYDNIIKLHEALT